MFKRDAAKKNAGIYYVYGLVYDHTNRPEQAVLAFNKAVELNPNFASALVDVGVHQLENKQYAKAQETFEKLTKQFNRNDAITLTSLGSAYRGHSADYPVGSADRNNLIVQSEAHVSPRDQAQSRTTGRRTSISRCSTSTPIRSRRAAARSTRCSVSTRRRTSSTSTRPCRAST